MLQAIVSVLMILVIAALAFHIERTGPIGLTARIRIVLQNRRFEFGEMTLVRRDELVAQKESFLKAAREIAAKAEGEKRDFTPEERAAVQKAVDDARKAHQQILEADGDAKLMEDLNALGRPVGELAKGGGGEAGNGKSAGERFANAPEFKAWHSSIAPNGTIPESFKGLNSPAIAFRGVKDILAGSDTAGAGALVQSDRLGLIDQGAFMRPLVIRDLVTGGTTGSDSIEYVKELAWTNNAAPVPEATGTAAGDAVGDVAGAKPQSSFTLVKETTTVKTIAHWLPATKRALSDAAQVRTLIDNFLRYGLEEQLEDQIMVGDGTGENFDGILNTSGIQAQAWDTDLLVTTRKAKTKVRTVGRARATAFVLNPEDNERLDLLRDDNGQFYFGGPSVAGGAPLWGLPRVESEAVPAGTGLVADWRRAILWDREQAAIQVSDSHADFFVRNLVAILAEMRAAFAVIRPTAFVTIDLTA